MIQGFKDSILALGDSFFEFKDKDLKDSTRKINDFFFGLKDPKIPS